MIVLIVDDENDLREAIKDLIFTNTSIQVFEASNVSQAKRLLGDVSPDLIISDVNMPGESGLDLFNHFLTQEQKGQFIFFSASKSSLQRSLSTSKNALFVEKPDFASLKTIVSCGSQ